MNAATDSPMDSSGSTMPGTITRRWPRNWAWTSADRDRLWPGLLHRDIGKAYATAESFQGTDLAELLEEDSHPNSFDPASRPVPAYPNQFGKLGELIKGIPAGADRHPACLRSAESGRGTAGGARLRIGRFVSNSADAAAITRLIQQNTPRSTKASAMLELEGLQPPAWRIALVTDREILGQQTLTSSGCCTTAAQKPPVARMDPNKMRPGDFVVHRNHGIGRFKAMEKLAISGDVRDYLAVQYADGLLRVAADQPGSLGRYRATSEKAPELNRMGGTAPGPRRRGGPRRPCERWRWIW